MYKKNQILYIYPATLDTGIEEIRRVTWEIWNWNNEWYAFSNLENTNNASSDFSLSNQGHQTNKAEAKQTIVAYGLISLETHF